MDDAPSASRTGDDAPAPRVLCALFPAIGHTLPALPVIAELVRRGCRVTATTSPELADRVRATGAETITYTTPITTEPPDRITYDELIEGFSLLVGQLFDNSPVIEKACPEPPDIIVHDVVLSLLGRVLAAQWARPNITMLPTLASNEHFSIDLKFAELSPPSDPDAQAHPALMRSVERILDYMRAHGLSSERFGDIWTGAGKPTIVFVPKEFQAAGDTFGDDHVFVGPCLDHTTDDSWQPPEGNPPVALITLGTTGDRHPEFFRRCAQAFTGTDWHIVMTLGNRVDPGDLGPLPPNIEVHRWITLGSVLPHASVLICHGGMGSIQESLHHGTPMVVIPHLPEHHVNAERVSELGLGHVLPKDTVSADLILGAVTEVAADDEIRARVERMRDHIRTSGGAAQAAAEIQARALTSTS